MTNIMCDFPGDREETLIAYVYDDITASERTAFERHLASCARCRTEVAAFGGVRSALARWSPPAPAFAIGSRLAAAAPDAPARAAGWKTIPVWAQAAAAVLVLGASAGLANLDVRYDANGLSVRTGWSKSAAAPAVPVAARVEAATPTVTPADLTAIEQRLRTELQAGLAQGHAAATEPETIRRVHAIVDDSEKRQRRELALRVAEVLNDMRSERAADLRRMDASLTGVKNTLGVEVLKQRQSLNYLMNVSLKP